jgi:hypothetical protein
MDSGVRVVLAVAGAEQAFGKSLADRLSSRGLGVRLEWLDTEDGAPRIDELTEALQGVRTLVVVGEQGTTDVHDLAVRILLNQPDPPPLGWVIAGGDDLIAYDQGAGGTTFDLREGVDERAVEAIAAWAGLADEAPVGEAAAAAPASGQATRSAPLETPDAPPTDRGAEAPGEQLDFGPTGSSETVVEGGAAPVADVAPLEGAAAADGDDDDTIAAAGSEDEQVPAEELAAAFGRFTDGARQAILAAEQLRDADPGHRIRVKHLVAGLYQRQDGQTRSALSSVDVADLADALHVAPAALSPTPDAPPSELPSDLPPVSRHVGLGIREAAALAQDGAGRQVAIRARHLFAGMLRVNQCSQISRVLDLAFDPTTVLADANATARRSPIAGFASDDAAGEDLLDIGPEVRAMASVIAARDVEPPLAIGLFGDWGTGKTFFMNLLERRIAELALGEQGRTTGDRLFCRHIVQLRFNAWHYIEQDLWASLASSIFDGLDEWIGKTEAAATEPPGTWPMRRAELLTQHARARDEFERAEERRAQSQRSLDAVDRQLGRLDAQYGELVRNVPPTELMGAVARIASSQPELRQSAEATRETIEKAIEDAGRDLNVDAEDWRHDITHGRFRSAIAKGTRGIARDARLWIPIAVGAGAMLVLFVIAAQLAAPLLQAALGGAGLLIAAASPFTVPAARVLKLIVAARRESDRLVQDAKERERKQLNVIRKEDERLRAQAELDAGAARQKLDRLTVDLERYTPSRQMATFVKRRQTSEDYRSRLGSIAKARDDFEELTTLLFLERDAGDETKLATYGRAGQDGGREPHPFPQPIDRIVLYIDDLDRCKEKEVVAVLQAVHLLLAFRLFVVVVAVDPRWLLHSLKVSSRVFDEESARDEGTRDRTAADDLAWESTPLNYLEKIFQVPFALRPMGKDGFQAVIRTVTARRQMSGTLGRVADQPVGAGGSETAPGAASQAGVAVAAVPPGSPGRGSANPRTGASGAAATGSAAASAPARVQPVVAATGEDLNPGWLEILPDERAYMEQLHDLIATPRAVKRFVNVYRLLKATTSIDPASDPAEYKSVLTLLAVLTGYPSEATDILRALIDRPPTGPWLAFVRTLDRPSELLTMTPPASGENRWSYTTAPYLEGRDEIDAERWLTLLERLERIEARVGALDAAVVARRARDVARYGFESSRVLGTVTRPRHARAGWVSSPPSGPIQ